MKKLLLIVIILTSICCCKTKQKMVETVHYVHDTAYYNHDSVVYRYLSFNGTEEERTAEWRTRDSITGRDTVWRYRYRTITARGDEAVHAKNSGSNGHITKDTTSVKTTKARSGQQDGSRRWYRIVVSVLLALNIMSLSIGLYWGKTSGKKKIKHRDGQFILDLRYEPYNSYSRQGESL